MSVVRVVKNKDYTAMANYHLKEKDMSLKAIGLLSIMLSLPENWDYSVSGLSEIRKESRNTINEILKELERFGYLNRTRIRDEKGKIVEVEYTIYESPYLKNQDMDYQDMENQDIDFLAQLNTNKVNTNISKYLNNKKEIYKEKFKKPTLEEIVAYCKERNNTVDAKRFYDYYETDNWKDVKNWKKKLITWEMHQPKTREEKKKDKQREIDEICKNLAYLDEVNYENKWNNKVIWKNKETL